MLKSDQSRLGQVDDFDRSIRTFQFTWDGLAPTQRMVENLPHCGGKPIQHAATLLRIRRVIELVSRWEILIY